MSLVLSKLDTAVYPFSDESPGYRNIKLILLKWVLNDSLIYGSTREMGQRMKAKERGWGDEPLRRCRKFVK